MDGPMTGPAPVTWLQTVDPTLVLDLPGLLRALVAFATVLLLGAGLLWRYDGLVDRSMDASIGRPLSSLGYGVAAHATIAFFSVYAASQLGPLTLSGRSLGSVGLVLGVIILAVIAALGFTVVGTAVVELGGTRPRWYGLVLGAVIAGLVALIDPLIGGFVWLVVVSTGIGGQVRAWFHAADDVEAVQ